MTAPSGGTAMDHAKAVEPYDLDHAVAQADAHVEGMPPFYAWGDNEAAHRLADSVGELRNLVREVAEATRLEREARTADLAALRSQHEGLVQDAAILDALTRLEIEAPHYLGADSEGNVSAEPWLCRRRREPAGAFRGATPREAMGRALDAAMSGRGA